MHKLYDDIEKYLETLDITTLPKGRRMVTAACPLARGLKARFGLGFSVSRGIVETLYPFEGSCPWEWDTPKHLAQFIDEFDDGKHPHLQE